MPTIEFGMLLRGALVLAFACTAVLLLWRASANLRRSVLVLGFAGALLTPVLTLALERTPAPHAVAVATSWARPRVDPMFEPVRSYRWQRVSTWVSPSPEPRSRPNPLWLAFFLGAGFVLVRLIFSHLRVLRSIWRARPADEILPSIERAERATSASAQVSFSADVKGPIATGVLTPRVLLPEEARDWSEARLYTVLVHELTHVKQRDALAQLVAELTCAVQWWNPIAWWAKKRLERERELAADERVLASGMLPSEYAAELLSIAAELDGIVTPRAGVPVLGRSKISQRIERILGARRSALPGRLQATVLFGFALGLTTLVACVSSSTPSSEPGSRTSQKPVASGKASSIQPTLQRVVDAETARTKQEWAASAVTVVILEPKTGRVLALGNPALATANRTPGSTFKPLVVAAALETGAIQPDDRFDCENGERKYPDGVSLRDAGFGELSVTEILAQSSNIGVSKIFDKLGGPTLTAWFTRFHLNEPVLDATAGSLGALDDTSAGSMKGAVIAIGVGVKVSPLHLAAMYGAFANQGLYVPPTLDADANGKPDRVLQPATAARVLGMLESVVERGTGKAAHVNGVRVAGKTGTADLDDSGTDNHSMAYFAGIVPADAPRYVIVVMVEDPKEGASGGRVAAPVFARIASQIL